MRVLICSFSTPGFLFPIAGIGDALRRRGHDVAVASGLPSIPWLAAAELPRIERGRRDGPSFDVNSWHDPAAVILESLHLEYALTRFSPNVIVAHQLCHAALAVAERHAIPIAVMGFLSYLYPFTLASDCVEITAAERRRQWRLNEELRLYNETRQLLQLRPRPGDASDHPMLGDAFMVRTTPYLERDLDLLPARVNAVGSCSWEPPSATITEEEDWQKLKNRFSSDTHRPLLYVHCGRSFGKPSFWPRLMDAVSEMDVQVVGSIGRMDVKHGELPRNVAVNDHISQRLVLPHSNIVVCGGHSAAAIGAVTHGLPSVLFPHGGETVDNSERLAQVGAALSVNLEDATKATIQSSLEAALSDAEIANRARALQAAFNATSSLTTAATLIERLVADGAPLPRSSLSPECTGASYRSP